MNAVWPLETNPDSVSSGSLSSVSCEQLGDKAAKIGFPGRVDWEVGPFTCCELHSLHIGANVSNPKETFGIRLWVAF
jgi:hypothetical protein